MTEDRRPILVVDDEEVVATSLRDLLEGEGYRVAVASSAEEALALVGRESVLMIITDIQMPGMNGLQLQKQLKELVPLTPVVVMTAFPTVERAVAALHAGAVNFITKPFDINVVLDTVHRTVQSQEQMRRNLSTLSFVRSRHEMHVPGLLEHVGGLIYYFVERTAIADLFVASARFQIRLALDEILVNCVTHGTRNNPAKLVHIHATVEPERFEATIEDDGEGFDVDAIANPKEEVNLWELSEHGRGIFLVRCYMDEVEYSHQGRRVRIVKYNRETPDEV